MRGGEGEGEGGGGGEGEGEVWNYESLAAIARRLVLPHL